MQTIMCGQTNPFDPFSPVHEYTDNQKFTINLFPVRWGQSITVYPVNQYSQNINVYWKNPRFKGKVMELANKIYDELNEVGFLDSEYN